MKPNAVQLVSKQPNTVCPPRIPVRSRRGGNHRGNCGRVQTSPGSIHRSVVAPGYPGFYDVALRGFGLLPGALALKRLFEVYQGLARAPGEVDK